MKRFAVLLAAILSLGAAYGLAHWALIEVGREVIGDGESTTAIRLDPLEEPSAQARAEPASQGELLATARATLASQIEPGLPAAPIDAWLAVLVGPRASLAWSLDDCGEQTGVPEVDAARDLPVCAGLEARLPDGRVVSLGFLVGSEGRGAVEERGLYFAGVVGSDGTKSFRTLSALARHLRGDAQ